MCNSRVAGAPILAKLWIECHSEERSDACPEPCPEQSRRGSRREGSRPLQRLISLAKSETLCLRLRVKLKSVLLSRAGFSQLADSVQRLPLWLLALLSLGGYTLMRFWFPLAPYFNHVPQPDICEFAPSVGAGLGYVALLCVLFGLYWLAYQRTCHSDTPLSLVSIMLAAVLFSVPLLSTFPFNATDVYRYFIRGRISVVYRQSPFLMPPDAFSLDPYVPLAGVWAGDTSPYGPVWELTAAVITLFSKDDLRLGLLLFKGLAGLVHLATAGLIWIVLGKARPAQRAGRTLLWAWNPALLLTFAVDGHNDGLMLFWLLLGFWLMQCRRPALGQIFMVLAPLTKAVGLFPLPFFFLASWRRLPSARAKARFLLASALGSLAVVCLAFLPFGSPLTLARRLLQEASTRGGFSSVALLILAVRRCGFNLSAKFVVQVASVLFGLLALWLLWRAWRGRSPLRATADVFAAYLAQAFRFRIWYAAWPFPWLLLDLSNSSRRLKAGLWLLLTSQLSVFIYGHLWFYLLGGDHLFTHLIGVPFTFALPLLLAFLRPGGA